MGESATTERAKLPIPEETLQQLYTAFNARDLDRVLAALDPEVDWPNGWEGGRLLGRDAVRDYWTRQWAELDPHVTPEAFTTDTEGRTTVEVHAVIRDRDGKLLADHTVLHRYTFEAGLIRKMEICELGGFSE
jgi:nuclear transport factor 2 (NTF2) superfamily protein